jgi:hypothetical protein
MENGEVELFGGYCDEEVRDLTTALTSLRQQALDLECLSDMRGRRFHCREGIESINEQIPFGGVARREADLQVADRAMYI